MDAVLRARRISVLVNGQRIATGSADEFAAATNRFGVAYLGEGDTLMLKVAGLQASYPRAQVLFDIDLEVGQQALLSRCLAERHGQDHDHSLR